MYSSAWPVPRQRTHFSHPVIGRTIAEYEDPQSGCRFIVATPDAQPRLWRKFLNGAAESYRRHGVESVLEYDEVLNGESTTMFFSALDARGSVVGGMRVQGPYDVAEQAHAVCEWNGAEGSAELLGEINDRLDEGVIEMKTGWVSSKALCRPALTDAVARIFVHSLQLIGARYALGTVAQHAQSRWRTTGGVASSTVCPVAYPDDRYQTVAMWWDRETVADLAGEAQLRQLHREFVQLGGNLALGRLLTANSAA